MAQKFIQTNRVLNRILNSSGSNGSSSGSSSSAIFSQHHQSQITNSSFSQINSPSSSSHGGVEFERLDKKHFDKVYKQADKVIKHCQSERMNLTNSPPYIIDILQDICSHLQSIHTAYENKLHILNEIEYFNICIFNIVDKLDRLINMFKQYGKKIYEETSGGRKELIKFSLRFSHILTELKALFPKYIYDGQNFRIAKAEAAEFWKANFDTRIIVPWEEFRIKLNRVHEIHGDLEVYDLRRDLGLTGTRYVSIFEFDVFTRLFQPWKTLVHNWNFIISKHPGYCAFMTYDEVYKSLQKHIDKPGSYVFRLSCTKLGQWAIGYVTSDKKILQTIPQSLVQALIDGEKQGLYLYPDGREATVDIRGQMAIAAAERVKISREQYDMYCDMGVRFEKCKICLENDKDRKLEPCGHFICSSCLSSWQEKNGINASCPFCRCEIKAFEPIIIDEFVQENLVISEINAATGGSDPKAIEEYENSEELLLNFTTDSFDMISLNNSTTQQPKPGAVARAKQLLSSSQLAASSIDDNEIDFDLEGKPRDLEHEKSLLIDTDTFSVNSAINLNPSPSHSQISHKKSSIILQVPTIPAPPLPSTTLIQPPQSIPPPTPVDTSTIVKLKLENENQLKQLVELGFDYAKSACALYLANSNFDLAIDILNNYT